MPFYAPDWASAITRGNDIYFRDPNILFDTPESLGLLGHELVHVEQYSYGMTDLLYLLESLEGYKNNPYEIEAYKLQEEIVKTLRKKYGNYCP